MTRRKAAAQEPQTDSWVIGPSVCGNFCAAKEICHDCVAKALFRRFICFKGVRQ